MEKSQSGGQELALIYPIARALQQPNDLPDWALLPGSTELNLPLAPPDSLHLLAAQGWLELGNHIEANGEPEKFTPVHPIGD